MKLKIMILLAITALVSINANDNKSSDFIGYEVGDQVNLYDEDVSSIGYIYFFVGELDCPVCVHSINSIVNSLTEYDIQFRGFLSGQNQKAANKYKDINNFDFQVISDKMELYKNYYKVQFVPTYIILNSKGKIIAYDKCGGVKLRFADIKSIFEQLNNLQKKEFNNYNLPYLKEFQRKSIKHASGKNLLSTKKYYIHKSKYTKNLFLTKSSSKQIFEIDSNGNILQKIFIDSLDKQKLKILQHFGIEHTRNNSLLCKFLNMNYEMTLYEINLKNYKIKTIPIPETWPPYNVNVKKHNGINDKIYIAITPSNIDKYNIKLHDTLNTVMIIDKDGNEIKKFGKINKIYKNLKISRVLSCKIDIDENGNLYESQSSSNIINNYDPNGKLIKKIKIQTDTTFKIPEKGLSNVGNAFANWANWNNQISYFMNIDVNENDELSLVYVNTHNPEGIIDPTSKEVTLKYYIHKSDLNGDKIWKYDIQIPENSKYISTNNNMLYLVEIFDDRYDLVTYKIVF